MARENIKHWRIGDVEVARIVEVNDWEDDIAMLLPDGKAEYVQKLSVADAALRDARRARCSFPSSASCSGRATSCVMIDTCIGNDRQREFHVFCNMQTTFLEDLAAAGFPPADHQHGDVLASALRSCRLEHAQGERQVGTDLPAGALSLRQERSTNTGSTCATRAATTTSITWPIRSTPSSKRSCMNSSGPTIASPMKCGSSRRRGTRPDTSACTFARGARRRSSPAT